MGSNYLIPLLDILLPGLLPAASPQTRLPRLERWLARAELARDPSRGMEAWLGRAFGLDPAPVAAVSLAVDEAPQPGHWLRADPVYARVQGDTLVLHPAGMLSIEPDEARALVATLRDHFAADGMEFRVPRPDRWYVRVPAEESPVTLPLPEALGQDLFRHLPRGKGRIRWESALTEAQMMLSTHPVNIAREAARRPPVNAIWFWGEGALPRDLPRPYAQVFATDPFAAGLAHLSGATLAPPPPSPRDVAANGPTLLVIDAAAVAWATGDATQWESAARSIDDAWLSGMGELLARFGRVRLILPARQDTCVATLSPSARWRFWRTERPVAKHA